MMRKRNFILYSSLFFSLSFGGITVQAVRIYDPEDPTVIVKPLEPEHEAPENEPADTTTTTDTKPKTTRTESQETEAKNNKKLSATKENDRKHKKIYLDSSLFTDTNDIYLNEPPQPLGSGGDHSICHTATGQTAYLLTGSLLFGEVPEEKAVMT